MEEAMLPMSWARRPGASGVAVGVSPPVGRRELARALDFAAAGTDPEALDFAIEQATAGGVKSEAIERARARKRQLEEEASGAMSKRARLEAATALDSALGSGSADMLELAILQAEVAGVHGETLERARVQREGLVAAHAQTQAQQEALAAMRLARRSMDIPSLLLAAKACEEVGADPELMRDAALGDGAQRQGMAACILASAHQEAGLAVLDRAIEWARAEDVSVHELVAACRRRAVLEETEVREESLTEAASALAGSWNVNDPEALAMTIERARRAGVSAQMIRLAEKRLVKLRTRSAAASAPLTPGPPAVTAPSAPAGPPRIGMVLPTPETPAVVTVDVDAPAPEVQVVPVFATEVQVAPAVATERQQACKEASAALKTAMVRGSADALATAIEQAEKAGVSREQVAPARRKLARLRKPSS